MSSTQNQNKSPAGHSGIAYTPSCTQVFAKPGSVDGWNAWGIELKGTDAGFYQLIGLPTSYDVPGFGTHDAYAEMSASGYCALGGTNVPLIKVDQSAETSSNQLLQAPSIYSRPVELETKEANTTTTSNIPDIYTNRPQPAPQEVSGGTGSFVTLGLLVIGGYAGVKRYMNNIADSRMQAEYYSHERNNSEDLFIQEEIIPEVSASPVLTSVVAHRPVMHVQPCPITRIPETRSQQDFSSENRLEKSSENSLKSPEKSVEKPENISNPNLKYSENTENFRNMLTRVHAIDITHVEPSFSDEKSSEKGTFQIDFNNHEAFALYKELSSSGVTAHTDLGWQIFGIRGGGNWNNVSNILNQWKIQMEETHADHV